MCFGARQKDDGSAARSRDLDRLIRQDEKRMSKEVKLLLLGTVTPPPPNILVYFKPLTRFFQQVPENQENRPCSSR